MFPVALACGNTMILKPSEKVPGAAMMLANLAQEAGVPDGVLQIVVYHNLSAIYICSLSSDLINSYL